MATVMQAAAVTPVAGRAAPALPAARFLGAPLVARKSVTVKAASAAPVVAASAEKEDTLSPAFGLALLTTLASAAPVQAAQEVAQLADSDIRPILLFLAPAVALSWVGYNILGPAQNQLKAMADKKAGPTGTRRRGLAAGLGLAGSMLAVQAADAAQEVAQLADSDIRPILLFLAPAVALSWVGYNILGPAQNQLKAMADKKAGPTGTRRRGLAAGLGLAGSMLAVQAADAAQEVAQLADSDIRPILLILAPAVALSWVGYNILGPAQNQLKAMADKKAGPTGTRRK